MKIVLLLGACFTAVLALALPACAQAGGAAAYGSKVNFAKGRTLTFPDFDLTYVGRRHVASPKHARGFDYDDFTVSRGGVSKTVSWSSGTGDISWADFEFGGHKFELELVSARKIGRLKDNELVVTKR